MYIQEYHLGIRDINYGQHMDHLALLNYLHETRVRFLRHHGYSEIDVDGNGSGLVVAELNCKYISEGFYGDKISVSIIPELISPTRLVFNYNVIKGNEQLVAKAAIRVAFIATSHKVIAIPEWLQKLANM